MSISSLPAVKFQFPRPRDEERGPWDREQIAALTVALQASLARDRANAPFFDMIILISP
jgi:hypothetical protein